MPSVTEQNWAEPGFTFTVSHSGLSNRTRLLALSRKGLHPQTERESRLAPAGTQPGHLGEQGTLCDYPQGLATRMRNECWSSAGASDPARATSPSLGRGGQRHLDRQPTPQAAHRGGIPHEAAGGLLPEMGGGCWAGQHGRCPLWPPAPGLCNRSKTTTGLVSWSPERLPGPGTSPEHSHGARKTEALGKPVF